MINLIGDRLSKRTKFFKKAADAQGVSVKITGWDEVINGSGLKALNDDIAVVKIDPQTYTITELGQMHDSLVAYKDILKKMDLCSCRFLNTPKAILHTLDKKYTKSLLEKNKIPVTSIVKGTENIISVPQLFKIIRDSRIYSVFVKPVNYSGAAGVVALRLHPGDRQMKMYTTCRLENGRLYNTKRLYASEDATEITCTLEKLIEIGIIVERWYPKDIFNGKTYDLRVVYQFGRVEYIVARQSDGPVTNLHLNNQALSIEELGLGRSTISGIEDICQKAMSVFDGLTMAGIDVMLDRYSRKPRIIEINGQGDLIYQDIFAENRIYTRQVKELCRSLASIRGGNYV